MKKLCACGCGEPIKQSSNGTFRNKYILGHNLHVKEWREKVLPTLERGRKLTGDALSRKRKNLSAATKGIPKNGEARIDNPNHARAIHWIVRAPNGELFEFDNLQSWCRKNEEKFLPDDYPNATTPLWLRAAYGFNNQKRTDRKGQTHWKGWTLVSNVEKETFGCPDLLSRDNFQNCQRKTVASSGKQQNQSVTERTTKV